MNLPIGLTLTRIVAVPLLIVFLISSSRVHAFIAAGIFILASITDWLDGVVARRRNQVTTLGTLLDPIADKLLISSALIALVQVRVVPAWIVILIVGREFAVTGLRSIAASAGYTIVASELGKTKMVAQVIAVSMVLLGMHWPPLAPWAMAWIWGVVLFALISAVDYFRKFWRKVDDRIKRRRRVELLLLEREQKRELIRARRRAAQGALQGEEQRS